METKDLLEAAQTIKILKSTFEAKQNEWLPVIAAVLGALAGGIASFIPNLLLETHKRRNERESVKSALLAEIKALLCVIEHRQYLDQMKQVFEQQQKMPGLKIRYQVKVPDHYSRVYQAHVDRLGVIQPALSSKIIQFYHLLDSIVQDVTPGGSIADNGGDEDAFRQLIALAESALALGKEITQE